MQYRQIYKNNKTMMYKIIFKDNLVNLNARVNSKNEVEVKAPNGLELELIDNFVLEHFDKFYNFITNRKEKIMFNLDNNIIYLHGIRYEINVQLTAKKQSYEIIANKIYLFIKNEDNKQAMIQKILFDIGHNYIVDLAKTIAKKHQFKTIEFDTKWYKNKWGQCEPIKRKITLAIQLIMFNDEIIEYVIIHELCHLLHPNHSSEFWKTVESYYPKYKWAREKLKFQV